MAVTNILGERGDEIRVETGTGKVTKVEPHSGGRNAKVTIKAPHLREDVTGWVDMQGPLWPRVEFAAAEGIDVWYRVDVHRKRTVDPAIPLADVAKREKIRDLVGFERPENAPQSVAGAAPVSAPAQTPPAAAGPPAAAEPTQSAPSGDAGMVALEKLDKALRSGLDDQQAIGWLVETCTDLGVTDEQITKVREAAARHRAAQAAAGQPDANLEAAAAASRPARVADAVDAQRARHNSTPEEEWGEAGRSGVTAVANFDPNETGIPDGVDPAQVDGLLERADGEGPVARAATDALGKLGVNVDVARRHLAEARDPDRVAELRPPADVPPEAAGPAPAAPGARPPVSATSGLSRARQPIASDNRPWEFTNSDGRLNLSSYAAGAVMEFTNLAGRLLITRARDRAAETAGAEIQAPTEEQLRGLAGVLLNVADEVQHHMRGGGRVDRMASSHKLARQAVRESLDLYPVPWGAAADEREAWRAALLEHGTALMNVAIALLENLGTTGTLRLPDAAAS